MGNETGTLEGKNLAPLKKKIATDVERIDKLKGERSHINDAIGEIRSGLAAEGIPKKALDMAMAYMNMDEDARDGFDVAYSIVREAMGAPVQGNLFEGDKAKSNVTNIKGNQ